MVTVKITKRRPTNSEYRDVDLPEGVVIRKLYEYCLFCHNPLYYIHVIGDSWIIYTSCKLATWYGHNNEELPRHYVGNDDLNWDYLTKNYRDPKNKTVRPTHFNYNVETEDIEFDRAMEGNNAWQK